ncbi:protein translocase subunit SecF [Patescibacteria group bacterium]|nr:protein translocase subunit SecF [Patescibacteria group bacterium]MBU1074588.1 protein translocase subunit SecF [Patescibacteria group bacterium]MBU1952377.1 protein translocase subunit SecF [Patescibacteria group bacterium]
MYNIIGTRKTWFSLSAILIVASVIFLAMGGLKLGIDFTGGSLLQVQFEDVRPTAQEVQSNIEKLELGEIVVQPVKDTEIMIRMKAIGNDMRESILASLTEEFGVVHEMAFESIGPTIGKELRQKAIIAILIVMLAIIAYVSWAFRKISSGPVPAYVFGLCAIIALAHDILIVTGIFAALGYFLEVEIGALFVTALLTILGFSVHDTIVVYDRIREGILRGSTTDFRTILNTAINATLVRSLNTSITTLFVLVALYLFGGESIKYFVLALILGIILGTYSSIFIASPLLLLWKRFFSK